MRLMQKLAVGATALAGLGVGTLGLGVAHASSVPHEAAAHVATTPASDRNVEADAPGGHQDPHGVNSNSGSQTGPDTASSVQADAPGGHQDPQGANSQSGSQTGPDTGASATEYGR